MVVSSQMARSCGKNFETERLQCKLLMSSAPQNQVKKAPQKAAVVLPTNEHEFVAWMAHFPRTGIPSMPLLPFVVSPPTAVKVDPVTKIGDE